MSGCKHEWSAEVHEGLRSRVCNRCNDYKVLDERNSYLLAANASGADLAKIGWLCGIRPDEYPLKAVERVVKELSAARVEVSTLRAEAAHHEKQLESADETWKELLEARARVEGLGTGMTALSMLLGHPPEGLIEAVRSLLQKQKNYEHDRAAWDVAAERMETLMKSLVAQREAARVEIARLREALETCANIGETRVANVVRKALEGNK